MKAMFLVLAVAISMFFASNAVAIAPPMNEDGGGGTNSYCGPSVVGKGIWAYGPVYEWGWYVCESIGWSPDYIVEGRCYGCTNYANWLQYAYQPTYYYYGTQAWVKEG